MSDVNVTTIPSLPIARCKFKLTQITHLANSTGKRYRFDAQYDERIPEDRMFFKYTPTGTFEMYVDNPAVEKNFTLGCCYYFDLTPA